jgi:hypothetical protein
MGEDVYRFLLKEYFDTDSAKNLSVEDLGKFANALQTHRRTKLNMSEQDKLIFSLWGQLFEQKKTGSGSRQSLNRWIKRQTGVERLEWLNTQQKSKLIEAMKGWLKRPSK